MAPSPLGLTPEIAVVPDALPIHQSTHACYPPGMPNLCSFPFLVHVTRGNIGLLPLPYERPLELPTYPWVRRRTQGIAPLSSGKSSLGPPILGHLHMETRHTPLGRFGFLLWALGNSLKLLFQILQIHCHSCLRAVAFRLYFHSVTHRSVILCLSLRFPHVLLDAFLHLIAPLLHRLPAPHQIDVLQELFMLFHGKFFQGRVLFGELNISPHRHMVGI